MLPTNTRLATNNFIKPENWDEAKLGPCGGLEVRAALQGGEYRSVISTWKPSPEDLAHLNRGGVIEVMLLRTTQCPMRLDVVDPITVIETTGGRHEIDMKDPLKPTGVERPSITINEDAHLGDLGHDEHGPATP